MSFRVSDQFPLWAELEIDRSREDLAKVLGVNFNAPDPFAAVPD